MAHEKESAATPIAEAADINELERLRNRIPFNVDPFKTTDKEAAEAAIHPEFSDELKSLLQGKFNDLAEAAKRPSISFVGEIDGKWLIVDGMYILLTDISTIRHTSAPGFPADSNCIVTKLNGQEIFISIPAQIVYNAVRQAMGV